MDAFGVLRDILDDYKSFVHGFLNILDPDVLEKVEQEVSNGLLWPEPWLALNPAFQPAAPSASSSGEVGCTRGAGRSSALARQLTRSGARSHFVSTRLTPLRSRPAASPTC